MARIASFQNRRLFLTATLVSLCVSCGSPDPQTFDVDTASNDPEGAALPLSIGGRVETEGDDEMAVAINCATALDITAERLASMSSSPLTSEIALIGRAEAFFVARAERAADGSQAGATSVSAAIGRRRNEKANEVTEQAQLAIACLRRFGESAEAQTGA